MQFVLLLKTGRKLKEVKTCVVVQESQEAAVNFSEIFLIFMQLNYVDLWLKIIHFP